MDLAIQIPETLIETLIKSVMENCPECSSSLTCVGWKYEECKYKFVDDEDGQKYTIQYPELRKGFEVLMKLASEGKFHNEGWDVTPLLNPTKENFDNWACNWDAGVVDALIQCAIFQDVIYG